MKVLVLTLTLFIAPILLSAQSYEIKGIYKNFIRTGTIQKGEEVRGYYNLYRLEKTSKGEVRYEIEILNENLKLELKKDLVVDKRMAIMEVAYNGKTILFKFYDTKENTVTYYLMDEKGEFSRPFSREFGKNKRAMQEIEYLAKIEKPTFSLFEAGNKGFVDIHTYSVKMKAYEITYISNEGKIMWNYVPNADKERRNASFLLGTDDIVLFTESVSKNQTGKDMTYNLLALSLKGDEVFSIPLEQDNYILSPQNVFVNKRDGNYVLLGEYYYKSKNIMKDNAEGIFFRGVNDEGLWVYDKLISYERDIKKTMIATELEEVKGWKIFFHDVHRLNDGTVIAVGEQYKRSADALKIASTALTALGGGLDAQGTTKFRNGDIVAITLDKDGNFMDFNRFVKRHRGTSLEASIDYASIDYIAKLMVRFNAYDYVFTQFSADNSVATIAYDDRVTEEDGKGKESVFHFQSYVTSDKRFTEDIYRFESVADNVRVLRGKPGFIIISEFFRKDKKQSFRLEPLNF
jgi:hypothetical protein